MGLLDDITGLFDDVRQFGDELTDLKDEVVSSVTNFGQEVGGSVADLQETVTDSATEE